MTNAERNPHIHPLNLVDPGIDDPNFQPVSYPQMPGKDPNNTLPNLTPEQEARQKELIAINATLREKVAKLFPTMPDFMKHVYDTQLVPDGADHVFLPRRVAAPGGYYAHKTAAAQVFTTMYEISQKDRLKENIVPVEITALSVAYRVVEYGVSVYYLGEDFIRAVAATELPKDFTLQDLHLPLPGLLFAFPTKFMQEYIGRDMCYVMAAEFGRGEYACPPQLMWSSTYNRLKITAPDKFAWHFHTYSKGQIGSYVSGFWKKDPIDYALTRYGYTDYTGGPAERVKDDQEITERMNALMFKLLVVLETRPALVETGVVQRAAKTNKRTGEVEQSELWSPNVIGFKYKAVRHAADQQGTHASPCWHWRKGHITHQRVGSLNSPDFVSIASLPHRPDGEVDWIQVPDDTRARFWRSHKRLWLEPTLINFDDDDGSKTAGK